VTVVDAVKAEMDKELFVEKVIECYHCFNDMNYKHYIRCDGKCYWCWSCSETQYMDDGGKLKKGHNPSCTNV